MSRPDFEFTRNGRAVSSRTATLEGLDCLAGGGEMGARLTQVFWNLLNNGGRDRGAAFTVRLPLGVPAGAGAEAMADLLRLQGHRVTVAGEVADGLAAAETALEQGDLDLVVSDLGLPDGSGLDLMRELSRRYALPGIALSGYGMEDDMRRSKEAGFRRHLIKPVNPSALEAAVRETASSSK